MPVEPQPRYGEQFIHKQDSSLHRSMPVELEQIRRARTRHDAEYLAGPQLRGAESDESEPRLHHGLGTEVHAKPAEKIEDWLAVLKHTHEGHRDDPRVLERIKASYHKRYVIKPEEIPEAAYQLEARIARNMGYGDIPITDEYRQAKASEIIAGQEESLDRWVDYLTSQDAVYPMWLKYWAFTSVLKMGKFEKKIDEEGHESARFARRTEDTVAPFPPLNPRALALALSAIEAKAAQVGIPKNERQAPVNISDRLDDTAFGQLLATESFSKLYTQFLIELPAYSAEGLRQTGGKWVKYDQGSDAQPLVDSLEGHPLEWCTAGIDTARSQLAEGDFYVYYSLDENGESTIPRVAIRMEDDRIAEVRGIAPDQELDPYIADVVAEKMQEFPDGEGYVQSAADMKRLTEIDERMQGGGELSAEDLRFVYELDHEIQSFGYERDPRIGELQSGRDFMRDMEFIFDTDDHNQIAHQLIEAGQGGSVIDYLAKFQGLDYNQIAHQIIETGNGWSEGQSVARNLDKFQGLDASVAHQLIENGWSESVARNLDKFQGLDASVAHQLIENGWSESVARNLDKFQGLDASVAHQLIENGWSESVAYNLDKFQGLDHNQIAHQLIEAGAGGSVARNLDKFQGLDHNQIAHQIIETGNGWPVARNLDKFQGLDASVAHQLIEIGWREGQSVVRNIDKFQDPDQTVYDALRRRGYKI